MDVIKASNKIEKFNKSKIIASVMKAGASRQLANKISIKVKKNIKNKSNTNKILTLTLKYLNKNPEIAARYDLKRAIMFLGPSGFPFEEYFSQILRNYGYTTQVGRMVKGKNIQQEIDIIASRKLVHIIETKYHNSTGKYVDTKTAMYT